MTFICYVINNNLSEGVWLSIDADNMKSKMSILGNNYKTY